MFTIKPSEIILFGQADRNKQCRPRSDSLWRSTLIRVYTVCHSVCIFWMHYPMIKLHYSNLRIISAIFLRCLNLFFFYGTLTAFFSLVPAAPNPPKPPKAPPLVSPFFAAAAFSAISLLNAIRVSLVYSSFLQESNNRPQWCVIHQWLHCLPNMSSEIFDQVRVDW